MRIHLGLLSLTLPAQGEHEVIKHHIFVHLSVCHLSDVSCHYEPDGWGEFSHKNITNFNLMQEGEKKNILQFSPVAKHQCLHQGKNTQLILPKGPGET